MSNEDLPPALRASSNNQAQPNQSSGDNDEILPPPPPLPPLKSASAEVNEQPQEKKPAIAEPQPQPQPQKLAPEKPTTQRPNIADGATSNDKVEDSSKKISGSCKDYEYNIINGEVQLVELTLKPNSGVVYHIDALTAYDGGLELKSEMNTGDVQKKGIFSKVLDAGKAAAKGEKVFISSCNNVTMKPKKVVFSSHFPGSVAAVNIDETGDIIHRDNAFLCASKSVHLAKASPSECGATALGTGAKFGKLEGSGVAFLCFAGAVYKRTLENGEVLNTPSTFVAARQASVEFKINKKSVNGKTTIFETVTGPGIVWIQGSPYNKIRDRIISNTLAVVNTDLKKRLTKLMNQMKQQINKNSK